jgi:hypothetical protein
VKCNLAAGINVTFNATDDRLARGWARVEGRDFMLGMSVSELSNPAENKTILLHEIPTVVPGPPDQYVAGPFFENRDCVAELLHVYVGPNEKPMGLAVDVIASSLVNVCHIGSEVLEMSTSCDRCDQTTRNELLGSLTWTRHVYSTQWLLHSR